MTLQAVALPFDPSALEGLSERLIRSHHDNNYRGALARLDAITTRWRTLAPHEVPGFELNGLKREELLAANSVWLHELYFDGLGGAGLPMPPAMALALSASFGSPERWQAEFAAMGRALGGGSGWVLLSYCPRQARLVHQWAADHAHALAAGVPILALDMYEHAYHMDFGAAAARYVDAFVANIHWPRVHERYIRAVGAASESVGIAIADVVDGARLIDVRRAAVVESAADQVGGARWQDPARVDEWAGEVAGAGGGAVIVYCVHGHEVSRATALRLRAHGAQAYFLRGGLEAWRAAGRPVGPRPVAQVP